MSLIKAVAAYTCVAAGIVLFTQCTANLAGTSSGAEARTASITGKIMDEQGNYSMNTLIRLVPVSYDPVHGGLFNDSLSATTNEVGEYHINHVDSGFYNIQYIHKSDGTCGLKLGVHCVNDTVVSTDTLRKPGAVTVLVPADIDTASGYFYLVGTTISVKVSTAAEGAILLDSVPAGAVPALYYTIKNGSGSPQLVDSNLSVPSGDTLIVLFNGWKFSKKLFLNTTTSGADVADNVTNFQVLIRLDQGNFDFSGAQKNGADIRFTKPDNSPLSFEIEQWDSAAGAAAIWVRMDTVYGNSVTQSVVMYWGNPQATGMSDGAAVFDTALQCQAVWHLNGAGTDTAKDATANRYNGVPTSLATGSASKGMIGKGQKFDGAKSFIVMPGTAGSRLNFPEQGIYTVSAWVNTDTLNGQFHTIASKGDKQYNLHIMYGYNAWEFSECRAQGGYTMVSSPASAGTWNFVAGVRNGDRQCLYVNGALTDSSIIVDNPTFFRSTGDDFTIGKMPNGTTYYFKGMIDEVRVSSFAYDGNRAKLCYMNQKAPDALVVFR